MNASADPDTVAAGGPAGREEDAGRPFIVWTVQRTGGTNLARALLERSSLAQRFIESDPQSRPAACAERRIESQWQLHEPFNAGDAERAFGALTEAWEATGDLPALEAALHEVLRLRVPFKHCVEMVPLEISEHIARVSACYGYRHVFLYRRSAIDRLLSLEFAARSGVWGRHFYSEDSIDARMFVEPLAVEDLVGRERFCRERLLAAWELLGSLDAWRTALAFEDLYLAAEPGRDPVVLMQLLRDLGLSRGGVADRGFCKRIQRSGEQGSRGHYAQFVGVEALERGLEGLPALDFAEGCYALRIDAACPGGTPGIVFAALDRLPGELRQRELFAVGGVVVSPLAPGLARLVLRGEAREREIRWGIRSPAMQARFPLAAGAGFARFRVEGLECAPGTAYEIVLLHGDAEEPVFTLAFTAHPDPAKGSDSLT